MEVVIIGGGAAGRSAALVLGRARVPVALVDAGRQSNLPSGGIGGLLGHDGTSPADLYAASDRELARYPAVEVVRATVSAVEPGWRVQLDSGRTLVADRLVLAAGMRYTVPELPGIEGLWGAGVFHCPFCHGWEHRDEPLAVLGGVPQAPERALLLRRWSDRVTLIDQGVALEESDLSRLAAAGVAVAAGAVERLVGAGRELRAVELDSGERLEVRGMLVAAPHAARDGLAASLGVETTGDGHVAVDFMGKTSVPGIWAAGDVTNPMGGVARAIAEGSMCAVSIVHDLVSTS